MFNGLAEVYAVFHEYDVDGGYGDPVKTRILVCIFENEKDACAYMHKWKASELYGYDDFYRGDLYVERSQMVLDGQDALSINPLRLIYDDDKNIIAAHALYWPEHSNTVTKWVDAWVEEEKDFVEEFKKGEGE